MLKGMLDRTNYRHPPGGYMRLWAGVAILCCTYLAIGAVAFLILDLSDRVVTSSVLAIAMVIGIASSFAYRRE